MALTVKEYQWLLKGLDCGSCAAKIEDAVGKLDGVSESNVNVMTQTLRFEMDDHQKEEVFPEISRLVHRIEPSVELFEKKSGKKIGADGFFEENKEDAGGHSHGHSHNHGNFDKSDMQKMLVRLAISLILLLVVALVPLPQLYAFGIALVAYLVVGHEVVLQAIRNIFHGQVFDENFLMTIATVSAFYIGQYPEAVAVMLFYQVGELFQDIAVDRSRRSVADLMDIRPDSANLKTTEGLQTVPSESIQVGDIIVVRPGEKVPMDGVITEGHSSVDTSALTGESVPRSVEPGEQVLSGFVNQNGVLEVQVEKLFAESTASKILDLVQNAGSRKAATENFITKFARYYTPAVVIIALLMVIFPPFVLPGATFNQWLYRASIFLVISCPCALVVSIPVGFFGGIGSASSKGILVKGSNFLEALNDVETIVMDKTGTLTKGNFDVSNVVAESGWSKDQVLELAAYAEQYSSHPIAESIKAKYGKAIEEARLADYNEVAGHGIQVWVDGKEVLAGNAKLMHRYDIPLHEPDGVGTVVYLAVDRKEAGYITIEDEIKKQSFEAIHMLKQQGVKQTVMLTGDSEVVAHAVADKLGIDQVYAGLLPEDKVNRLEELMGNVTGKGKVAFVGDGLNDTPVLARSDIGFAMGGIGSDAAIEAADVVIMDDDPRKLAIAIQTAKDTRKIVWQNIFFALGVKGIFLILGAFGVATMWEAVFADVGVTVLAVLNAMRILKK